jgi:carbon monoxide dehydrogenase subunit G
VVDRDPDWTFRQLHDPERLLACVPGASLIRLVDSRKFEARILVGVGPSRSLTPARSGSSVPIQDCERHPSP